MERYISKQDGTQESFDEEKMLSSLLRSGTEKKVALEVLDRINRNISDLTDSKELYKIILKHLKKRQPDAAIKYTLKKALFDMGPSGYVFERYFAKIMRAYGYKTEVSQIVKGVCVEHEVDVVAQKDGCYYMIECKYHNNIGTKSDIKTALYVYARFLDISKASRIGANDCNFQEVWLATNTKCTTEAIKYAGCVKLHIVAWHYPEHKNLEYYIENKKLYPVSILPDLSGSQKDILFENEIYTIQDLLEKPREKTEKLIKADKFEVSKLYAVAALLLT